MENTSQTKIMYRVYFMAIGLLLFALTLVGKLFYIQWVQGDFYTSKLEASTLKSVVLEASRGNIYADDGSILATTVPRYELRWDAMVVSKSLFEENKQELAASLAILRGHSKSYYLKSLQNARTQKSRYFLIGKNLTYSEFQAIKALPIFNLPLYKGGLIVEQQLVREHPLGKVAERTVGYEQRDRSGFYLRVGLEGAFGHYLKGESGRRLKQKIANGQWKPINDSNEKEPTEGYDLHTTINVNIQDIAHKALLQQLESYEADHGTVVVMETNTGDVKAIVNLGRTKKGTYYEKLNYAVGEAHEPGSTFKLMGMIAALEDGVVDVNDWIKTGKGELTFYNKHKVRDSKRGGYGTLTAGKVFEVSSNTGMVKIIYDNYKNNPKKFVDRLYNMGLNKPLGISIKGEAKPKIPYPTDTSWDGLELPWMAYGYGVTLTPLQTLSFYNAIANGGEMVKPKFLKQISRLGNRPEKVFHKEVLNPAICSKATVEKVQQMMFNVVDKKWGTGYRIKDETLLMAGKTGTSQVDYATDNMQYVSSFVGYFPANAPKYSCIVVIHKPNKRKGYYGATVAAPVFKTIAMKIYTSTPKEVHISSQELFALDQKSEGQAIPDLVGMTRKEAEEVAKKIGIKLKSKGKGIVVRQSIQAGTPANQTKQIIIELS
jgi:cell division protein FtsI (penicillin-binding protein 3)